MCCPLQTPGPAQDYTPVCSGMQTRLLVFPAKCSCESRNGRVRVHAGAPKLRVLGVTAGCEGLGYLPGSIELHDCGAAIAEGHIQRYRLLL
jgi:hypothetical protein